MSIIRGIPVGTLLCAILATSANALTVTSQETGAADNRVDIAIIGDGYTASDINTLYIPAVQGTMDYMFGNVSKAQPYPRYQNFFNVHRIDIVSQDSGVDILSDGIFRNTALDGERGCTDYTIGICGVDWSLTHQTFEQAAADFDFEPDWHLVLLNDDAYSGAAHYPSGKAPLPVYSGHHVGGWSPLDLALHEGAHAWHRLADEYSQGNGTYTGSEPTAVNITTNSTGLKWDRWIGYVMPNGNEIGVFEGGFYHDFGIYRPSNGNKMNGGPDNCHSLTNDCGHDMVAIEKIILDIYDLVRPIDAHLDNNSVLQDPNELWVEVVDPNVLKVDWFVDGAPVSERGSEDFTVANHLTSAGTYQVTARVWDEVIEHAFSDNNNPHALDMVRKDLNKLEQSVSWTVNISGQPGPSIGKLAISSVSASSDDGNVPANTLDNNLDTRWSSLGDNEWIDYSLGSVKTITAVNIAWFKGNQRTSSFTLSARSNSGNWIEVFSGSASGSTLALESIDITDIQADTLRYTGFGNSSNNWNSVTELEIEGY